MQICDVGPKEISAGISNLNVKTSLIFKFYLLFLDYFQLNFRQMDDIGNNRGLILLNVGKLLRIFASNTIVKTKFLVQHKHRSNQAYYANVSGHMT